MFDEDIMKRIKDQSSKSFVFQYDSTNEYKQQYFYTPSKIIDKVIFESMDSYRSQKYRFLFYSGIMVISVIPAFQYFMMSKYLMSFMFTIPIGVCTELLTYIYPRYKNTITRIELDDTFGYCKVSISNSKPKLVKISDIKKPRDDQFVFYY